MQQVFGFQSKLLPLLEKITAAELQRNVKRRIALREESVIPHNLQARSYHNQAIENDDKVLMEMVFFINEEGAKKINCRLLEWLKFEIRQKVRRQRCHLWTIVFSGETPTDKSDVGFSAGRCGGLLCGTSVDGRLEMLTTWQHHSCASKTSSLQIGSFPCKMTCSQVFKGKRQTLDVVARLKPSRLKNVHWIDTSCCGVIVCLHRQYWVSRSTFCESWIKNTFTFWRDCTVRNDARVLGLARYIAQVAMQHKFSARIIRCSCWSCKVPTVKY